MSDADEAEEEKSAAEVLEETWASLSSEERVEAFRGLPRAEAGNFFLKRRPTTQALLVHSAPPWEKRLLMRMLAPDEAADVLQEFPSEDRAEYLALLDDRTRHEAIALLAYHEDEAGGLMSPRFARVRPDMTVDEAISYVRRQSRERAEIISYLYVLDAEQRLQGILSYRDLFTQSGDKRVSEIMLSDYVSVGEHTDQEEVARLIAQHDIVAVPVVDEEGRMRGIITVDDIVDVVQTEATEDIQKLGGMQALDRPYLQTSYFQMFRKRAPWLALLFLGEMLTATAMGFFEGELEALTILALFIPLIISSGGNSGSQATTLIIRAMALDEVRPRDAWRVAARELRFGVSMGLILAALGLLRIVAWDVFFPRAFGVDALLLGLTVAAAVLGVVAWGTIVGAMLPFLLRRIGLDPASASAPLVATLVDVFGVVIYFGVARFMLASAIGG